MRSFPIISSLLLCLFVTACSNTYYKAYEQFGVYKRDLLKKKVIATRDEEKKTQEEFKDALTRLKEITNFQGGELETQYRKLQSQYDSAAKRVEAVHSRVKQVETVAKDLFSEWEKENLQITTPSLRASSQSQLDQTRDRYEELMVALRKAESTMDPVLQKFKDYVLALKHSLNAQAIASLKGESINIQEEIGRLVEEMNTSIAHADEFIKTLK